MRYVWSILFSLPLLLVRVKGDDNNCCPAYQQSSKNLVRQLVTLTCSGQGRDYVDLDTSMQLCCPVDQQLVIYNSTTRAGVCCAVGQVYVGTAPSGKCCAPGEIVKDGQCSAPSPNSGCADCKFPPVCGNSSFNGLEFGKCYQIHFASSGQPLGLEYQGAYAEGGIVRASMYQVCKTASDCGAGPVASTDAFYLRDEMESLDAVTKWIGVNTYGVASYPTTVPAQAARFTAKTAYARCKCVTWLFGDGTGLQQLWASETKLEITFVPPKGRGLFMEFTQVPCDKNFDDPL